MTIDERKLTPESFELTKALSEIHNANTRIDVLLLSDHVNKNSKYMMKRWGNNLGSILREFKRILPDTWRETFEKEVLNDEDSGQIDCIITMLIQLPKGIKNEIEKYIETRHTIYNFNRNKNDKNI